MREKLKLQLRHVNIEVLNCELFQLESLEELEKCTKHYKSCRGDTHSENMIWNRNMPKYRTLIILIIANDMYWMYF